MASIKAHDDPAPRRVDASDAKKVDEIWRNAELSARRELRRNVQRGYRIKGA